MELVALMCSLSFSIIDAVARGSVVSSVHKDRNNQGFVCAVTFAWGVSPAFSLHTTVTTRESLLGDTAVHGSIAMIWQDRLQSGAVWCG
ncbi:Hypothetical predicted protein, partial [Olea europaea subsp. europaea]